MKREPSAIESKHCAAVSRAADCRVQRTSFYFEGFFFLALLFYRSEVSAPTIIYHLM